APLPSTVPATIRCFPNPISVPGFAVARSAAISDLDIKLPDKEKPDTAFANGSIACFTRAGRKNKEASVVRAQAPFQQNRTENEVCPEKRLNSRAVPPRESFQNASYDDVPEPSERAPPILPTLRLNLLCSCARSDELVYEDDRDPPVPQLNLS